MKIEEMIAANRADCCGCAACANICPKNAITLTRDAEGFAYPKINSELCIKCGQCDATCLSLNFTEKILDTLPLVFTATYSNDKILRHSSSGGVFSALSEIILNNGGVVFGAVFDKNWCVHHAVAKNLDELENMRSSKYVQSQIGDVYRQVKDALNSSEVLFSGTPCQCVGLKNFLGKDYDNLLTVEVICHGTPSPALWEYYVGELGYAHDIANINFRSKRNGWGDGIYIDINFYDKGHTINKVPSDLYGRLFLRNVSLRPACSSCKSRFPNGKADLSLGDAWGIKDFAPEMDDTRGVSIVFVHTAKGKDFFERANLKTKQIKFTEPLKKNKLFISPTAAPSRREAFFAELAKNPDWLLVMKKYYNDDKQEYRDETAEKISSTYKKKLKEILVQIRKNFTQNILIVSSICEKSEQKYLNDFFKPDTKPRGSYILQPKGEGQFTCTENFSGAISNLKDTAALSDFVKKNKIKEVFVEEPLDFGDDFPLIDNWIRNCGLPVELFTIGTRN